MCKALGEALAFSQGCHFILILSWKTRVPLSLLSPPSILCHLYCHMSYYITIAYFLLLLLLLFGFFVVVVLVVCLLP